jgi:enoyl-CoA hydratase
MSSHLVDAVLVTAVDQVLIITLNRPHVRNALNGSAARIIAGAIDRLESDRNMRVGVLVGAGGNFSSGMDFNEFPDGDLPVIAGRGLCGITQRVPGKPLIAAVEGNALGGGFELVLACDLIVAAESARFGLTEVKRGMVAIEGGAYVLPRRIPYVLAMELLLTGNSWGSDRAAQAGLINQIVPDGGALEKAIDLARVIASNGPMAVWATREIAQKSHSWHGEEGWEAQREICRPVFASADAIEGARAFVERRAPRFLGA